MDVIPSMAEIAASDLFQPVRLGPLTLRNRIVMAPLTRSRAGAGDAPGPMNARYYAQRAGAGLIISEASQISQQGKGYAWTPGIYTEAQVAGWKLVTDAVHARGGHIFCQLWHVGRISHRSLQPAGGLPVAPSAIRPEGVMAFTEHGFEPIPTPRALETDEIPGIVADYAHAAACARRAGFDGVEIHAANGYLIDQFLRSKTNRRTDRYGGSLANRARFLVEVAEAVVGVWGGSRVGVRFSPVSEVNDIADDNPQETFDYAVAEVDRIGLGYIHVIEGMTRTDRNPRPFDYQSLRRRFRGLYIANNCYTLELALKARRENLADLIAFGRPWISNPDLVERLRAGAPLAPADETTFYGGGEHGYVDYPAIDGTLP